MTMTTSAVSNTLATTSHTTGTTSGNTSLGKNEFLKLLIAQLANQDPLKPVDNQQFISQLAQFSSLEQMQNVSTNLEALLTANKSTNQLAAASLLGQNVTHASDTVALVAGQTPSAQVALEAPAAVLVAIQNASGRVVRTLDLGVCQAGTAELGWDGRDANGNALAAGSYTVAVSATAADGTAVRANLLTSGLVKSVSYEGGETVLTVGGSRVKFSDVIRINQP